MGPPSKLHNFWPRGHIMKTVVQLRGMDWFWGKPVRRGGRTNAERRHAKEKIVESFEEGAPRVRDCVRDIEPGRNATGFRKARDPGRTSREWILRSLDRGRSDDGDAMADVFVGLRDLHSMGTAR